MQMYVFAFVQRITCSVSDVFWTLQISAGSFTLSLDIDEVYTLSTITTAQRGTYPDPPPSAPFPKSYQDNFDVSKSASEGPRL